MGMTDEEAKKFEEMIDKKRDKVRNMTEEDTIEAVKEGIKKLKPLYKWRKWNGKKQRRELVYKTYPPDEYHKRK